MSYQSPSFCSGSYLHAVEAYTSPEDVVSALDEMGQPVMQFASFGSKSKQLASSRRAAAQQSKGKINALATASLGILEAMETHLAITGEQERRGALCNMADRMRSTSAHLRAGATEGKRGTQKLMDLGVTIQYVNIVLPKSHPYSQSSTHSFTPAQNTSKQQPESILSPTASLLQDVQDDDVSSDDESFDDDLRMMTSHP